MLVWRCRSLPRCSFSYQLDSLFSKKDDSQVERTGSLRPSVPKDSRRAGRGRPRIARAAVSEVLTKGARIPACRGESAHRRARHHHPAHLGLQQDGATCRDFLASYVKNGSSRGCRRGLPRRARKWEVRSMRP